MKNYRIKKFLQLDDETKNDYRYLFSKSKENLYEIGRFKLRNIKEMQYDDIIVIRELIEQRKEIDLISLFYCLRLSVPYWIVDRTEDILIDEKGKYGYQFRISKRFVTFFFNMPRFFVSRLRVQDWFMSIMTILNKNKEIIELESKGWRHAVDKKITKAVGNNYESFGAMPMIRSIAGTLGITEEKAWKLSWNKINTEMRLSAAQSRVNDNLIKLREEEMKNANKR